MSKRIFKFVHASARRLAAEFCMTAPDGWIARFCEATRTLDQNAAQWPILGAFAEQLELPVNGEKTKITDEEWKDVLTAVFRQESSRLAQWEGRVILLGQRTSKFKVKEFSDWMEFLNATAAVKGVVVYAENGEPQRAAA